MSRPRGIFPGGNVFQVPPPAVEASASSVVTDEAGEARGAEVTGKLEAITGGVAAIEMEAAGDFAGRGQGGAGGGFCAITGGKGDLAGAGVGVIFLFFASFPPFGVGPFSNGAGDATATFGASICWAGSTRINAFSAGAAGVWASPATTVVCGFGATRSR